MNLLNQQILFVSRPQGEPTIDNFEIVQRPVPELEDGQVLVKNLFLSLDPYMRGRMKEGKSYAQAQALNEVMNGGTVGTVLASRHARFAEGDNVFGMGGWQLYHVADGDQPGALRKVDASRIPLTAYLGAVGMPGVTAWYGLVDIIAAREGQTVTVSAASGAVGGAFGQLAKARGLRTVGIAGGPEKCAYVVDELGFDDCIDYKLHENAESLGAALKKACPDGIDGHFENVGGMVLDAVLLNANAFSRIALCGTIAGYNGQPIPLRYPQLLLLNRMRVEGFIVSEHKERWSPAMHELTEMVAAGKLKYRESVAPGLASTPEAFIGLLKGRNFGKQIVKLA